MKHISIEKTVRTNEILPYENWVQYIRNECHKIRTRNYEEQSNQYSINQKQVKNV